MTKRMIIALMLALFSTLAAASTSIATLRAPVSYFGGCFSPCSSDSDCTNSKCSSCNGTCRNVPAALPDH